MMENLPWFLLGMEDLNSPRSKTWTFMLSLLLHPQFIVSVTLPWRDVVELDIWQILNELMWSSLTYLVTFNISFMSLITSTSHLPMRHSKQYQSSLYLNLKHNSRYFHRITHGLFTYLRYPHWLQIQINNIGQLSVWMVNKVLED